jgi:hypothetical protein
VQVFGICLLDKVLDAAVGVVLGYQIEVLFFGRIDDFMEPEDVWMLKCLKNFKFLKNKIVGAFSLGNLFCSKSFSVYDFNCVHHICFGING